MACRTKVIVKLRQEFPTPQDAELHYQQVSIQRPHAPTSSRAAQSMSRQETPTESTSADRPTDRRTPPWETATRLTYEDPVPPVEPETCTVSVQTEPYHQFLTDSFKLRLSTMSTDDQLSTVNELFQFIAARQDPAVSIPSDFLAQSLSCMQRLKVAMRYNILYGVARGYGTMCEDGSDSRIPLKQMPTVMLVYVVSFFNSDTLQKVNMSFTRACT